MALKAQSQFTSRYEAAYNELRNNPFFTQQDWVNASTGAGPGNLDMHIYVLRNSKNINMEEFNKKYNTAYQDSETRLAALYNEVLASRLSNDDRFSVDVYKYDDAGNMLYDEEGAPKTERKTVSEYEYNRMIINQKNTTREQMHLRQLAEEARDPSFWGDVYGALIDISFDGILEFFNKTGALLITAGDIALNPDKTFEEDWFREWEANYKPILDRFEYNGQKVSDLLVDWEIQNSHLRDLDGNYTTAGRIVSGVATTAGEMMSSIIISGGLTMALSNVSAGTGVAAKAASVATKIIPTATYYAPLAAYGMGEDYKAIVANGGSISTGKMFANQLIKTGIEIGIEQGLGKIFGSTGLDKALFGRTTNKATSKLGKVSALSGLLHFGKESAQEATEEFLQEFSGFLVNDAFKRLVDDDFSAEFDGQSLIDAAIIGAIISAGSSTLQIASTKNKLITDADGKTRKLSKIASAYYNISMPTFLQKLGEAQKELDNALVKLPGLKNKSLDVLNSNKQKIQDKVNELNKQIQEATKANLSIGTKESTKNESDFARSIAGKLGKGFALDADDHIVTEKEARKTNVNELIAQRDKFEASLKKIDSELDTVSKIEEFDTNTEGESLSELFGEKFVKLYTAARSVQAFANFIGEERMTKAGEILGKIEKMGNEGKFDESEVAKARDEICNELQLRGIAVDTSFRTRVGESGITKIKHFFSRKDRTERKTKLNESDKNRLSKKVDELFKLSDKIENIAVTEDGKNVVSNETTMLVPEKELEQGAAFVAHDDAEQQLVESILHYNFHGDVLNRVITTYRKLHKEGATEREAISALLFDENFFLTMLVGNTDKDVRIADIDMYQFLSSLLYIEKNVVIDSIRKGVYVDKIKSVKTHVTNALTSYLKIQPFADYELDILSKAQRNEIREIREGFAVANRIVTNKATKSDMDFIYKKINAVPLPKVEKDAIGNVIDKGSSLEKRDALTRLDKAYHIAFYGSYDGKTYLPTNSLKNQAFNQLLYSQGLTIGNMLTSELPAGVAKTINDMYGDTSLSSRVKFLNGRFSAVTMGRYSIEMVQGTKVDPANGVFESGGKLFRVVDKKSTFESSDLAQVWLVKDKTNVSPASRHSQMVVKLLNDTAKKKGAGYYTINDIIANPSLLKESIRKNILKERLEVTPDATYEYLKSYFAKTEKVNISLAEDGRVIFVDVSSVKDVLIDDFSVNKVKSVVAGQIPMSELVDSKYRIPLMNECELVFADSPEYYSEIVRTGKNRGIKKAVIRLSKSNMNNLDALKTEFAHELQHLIQEVTRLNVGTTRKVLSLFDNDTAENIRKTIMSKVPNLFNKVDTKNKMKTDHVINEFLYYGSGEYAAYGAEVSGVAKLYPTLIQERGDRIILTLPWGDTFTSEIKGSKQMLDERFFKTYDLIRRVENGKISFTEMSKFVNDIFDIDPSIQIPIELRDKIFKAYQTVYGDGGSISFASEETIKSIKDDRNYAGFYGVKSGIIINSDKLVDRLINNDYQNAAKTILHEMIHSLTKYHIDNIEKIIGKDALDKYLNDGKQTKEIKSLTPVEKAALSLIKLHHQLEMEQGETKIYPLKDAHEMVAELVNPRFREYLKQKTLLGKIIRAIKSLLGFKTNNALTAADRALDDILNHNINNVVSVSDEAYLEAVKNEDWNLVHRQVRALSARNGFYSSELYHGTSHFGFTKPDVSYSDDGLTFFTTDDVRMAATYAGSVRIRAINEGDAAWDEYTNSINVFLDDLGIKSTDVINSLYEAVFDPIKEAIEDASATNEFNYLDFSDIKPTILETLNGAGLIDSPYESDVTDVFINSVSLIDAIDAFVASAYSIVPGTGIYSMYANLDNSFVIDANGSRWDEIAYEGNVYNTRRLSFEIFNYGFDCLIIKNLYDHGPFAPLPGNRPANLYIFRDPARQLRSADLVTYDDNGNIIPLSKRFDPDTEDLRFDEILGDADETVEINSNKHLHTKGRTKRTRVGKKASKGTPLEPFGGRRISVALQDFVMKSVEEEYRGIDKNIQSKIKDGTLTTADLYEFIREAEAGDEVNERTFRLINDTIFHNQFINSLEELDEYVVSRSSNYYALRAFIRGLGKGSQLLEFEDPKLYERALAMFTDDPVAKRTIEETSNRYWSGPVINEKNLRRLWMQHFDGSLESGGYIAAVARVAAYQGWIITGGSTSSSSINMNVGKGKDKSSTLKREDVMPDKSDLEDFNRFITDEREDLLVSAMDRELINKLIERQKSGENITWDIIDRERFELKERVSAIRAENPSEFMKLYAEYVSADEAAAQAAYLQSLAMEVSGNKKSDVDEVLDDLNKAEEQAKEILRPKSYVVANLKSMARTIRGNLNRKQRERFLKDNADLFDKDLKINSALYQDVNNENGVIRLKDESILLELEERVRQLSKDVRSGVYSTDESYRYKIATDKRIRRIETDLAKALAGNVKEKVVYVRVGMNEMSLDTNLEVPPTVRRFLDNAVKMQMTEGSIAKTKVKSLSEKDDVHVKMSCEEFFELNAETLHHLDQNDVNEIVEFFCSTAPITRNPVYSSIELYTLGYFVNMSGKDGCAFRLTDDQLDRIENHLKFVAHAAGTELSVWQSVEKMLHPEETIHKAMLKICGIEIDANIEGELIKAINSHDLRRIKEAKQRAYENALERYHGRKRTIFERLLRWEQMAMLSGPGTWFRNLGSNVLVTGANSLADVLGQMLPTSKKSEQLNQYKIMGTKIGDGYAHWIQTAVIDSGLLEMFSDGLVKYDPRQANKHGVENQLTKLVLDKIAADLFNQASSSTKFTQFLQDTLRYVMSDKRFIDKAFKKYLGKMLTEDRADVSGEINAELMNTIADAYVMALQDYMHTSNCFGKMESALKTHLYKHFKPTTADGIFFMYKQVFPFANASWNWFVEGLNYTPLGLAMGIRNFCKLENTVNAMEAARQKGETVRSARFAEYLAKRKIVKGSIGTVGFILGTILAAVGLVGVEENDDEYKLCFSTNDGPLYIDFSDVFGTSGILWGMSFVQGFKDADGLDYNSLMKVLTSSLNTMFLDSTFADVFNTFRYSDSFGDFLLSQPGEMLGMFFPNFIRTLANVSRKYKNNYESGFFGKLEKFAVQSFAPFSYLAPYQINPYTGEAEVENEGWFGVNLINAFSPIKVKNYNFGDTEMTAVSLGVKKGQLTGKYDVNGTKVTLSGEQITNLNQYYGKLNQKDLQAFINNQTKYTVEIADGTRKELVYSKMTEAQKKAVIERIMSNNGQLAKVYILTSSGYKYYASDSEYEKLKDAGIITNVYRKHGKYDGFVKN